MRNYLFLLLFVIAGYGQVSTGEEQDFDYGIKNNSVQTVTNPTHLTTTGADGTQGKVLATNFKDILEYASAVNLPVTGTAGKLYITTDDNKQYRWDGAVYLALSSGDSVANPFLASTYGFLPSASGQANSIAINNALNTVGRILVSIPGIYEIDDTIILPSNSSIEFIEGCTLKHVTPATGRYVNTFKNSGCVTSTGNENITIIGNGLTIDFNGHDGIEGGVNRPFPYQNGRISFYKVDNFEVSGIHVNDPQSMYGMYFFEMTNCAHGKINDINLERYPKDGLDFIHCHDIHVKDYRSTTGDDAIFMGTGWLDFDTSIGDTYNITFENWRANATFGGISSRIISTSWDNWQNGRTYIGSNEDASEFCVNAGRVYRKTTNGNQVASIPPVHTSGIATAADGIGWLAISDVVTYKNDVYNIRYINCLVDDSAGLFLWAYESPTFAQNTNTANVTDVSFYDCNFESDSGTATSSFSAFVEASCNIENISFFNCKNSFKENTNNLGYNTFVTIKQNAMNNVIKIKNINIENLEFNGSDKAERLIQITGDSVELDAVNILNSEIKLAPYTPLILISNRNALKTLNITNSKIQGISNLLFFNGSNWTPPTERIINTVNTSFINCRKIFTHDYSYPTGMNLYYNSFGCEFINTTDWILENNQGEASTVILNFVGSKTNTPSKIIQNPALYTKKIFDLDSGMAIVKNELTGNLTYLSPSQKAVNDALLLKQDLLTNPLTGNPSAGYVPKSNGSRVLNDGLLFDSGIGIGIGTTIPNRKLTIEDVGNVYIGVKNNAQNNYTFGSDEQGLIFFDDTHGRYMAKFDKTTGAFSVDGNISATNYTGSATLTGTPTAPTATAGTNTTQIATTAFVLANSGSSVNTSFTPITYSSTISRAHDQDNPNIEITLSGNLNLTVTGTTNGDSGMVNIYSSASETIAINGLKALNLTGSGSAQMIPTYFVHSTDGIRWYDGRESTGSDVDVSNLAESVGTTLWHSSVATSAGTVSSSGANWTGTGTSLTNQMVGAKLFIGNESLIIATVNTGAQTFTTTTALPVNVTNSAFEIKFKAYKINSSGSQEWFDSQEGASRKSLAASGDFQANGLLATSNGNVFVSGNVFAKDQIELYNNMVTANAFQHNAIYTVSGLPALESTKRGFASVSDALNPSTGQLVVGGGTTKAPVYWDGTNWIAMTGGAGGTIDAVPTDGSTNAVQSNGVFDALAGKANVSGGTLFLGEVEAPSFRSPGGLALTSTGSGLFAPNNGGATFTVNHPDTPGWTSNFPITAPNIPVQLKDFYADSNNTSITETDLYSYLIVGNRITATGQKIVSTYAGTFNDVTASSQLEVYFAGSLIGDTGALTMSVTGAWVINVSVIRTGASTARAMVNISTPGASTAAYTKYTSLSGLDFTTNNTIKITGTAGGATGDSNDITATYGNIIWQPAAQ